MLCKPKKRIAIYGVHPHSEVDFKLAEELYIRYPEISDNDIYTKFQGLDDCFERFFENRNSYDAVIAVNDLSAIDMLHRLKELDPEYIERTFFIGTMDSILSRLYSPTLSSTSYDGASLTKMLYKIYDLCTNYRNDFCSVNLKLKNYLISRETTNSIPLNNEMKIFPAVKKNLILNMDINNFSEEFDAPKTPICLESMLTSVDITDLQILYMLMLGKSVMDISDNLFFSTSSVKHRISNMYKFLNVNRKKDFMDIIKNYINPQNLKNYIEQQAYPPEKYNKNLW